MKHLTLDEADEEELEEMRRQEKERFSKPHLDYTYKLKCGGIPYTVRVPKLKGFTAEKTARMSKARPHAILEDDRPSCVTLTYVIMDTLARCPSQRALKQDICRYVRPLNTCHVASAQSSHSTCPLAPSLHRFLPMVRSG